VASKIDRLLPLQQFLPWTFVCVGFVVFLNTGIYGKIELLE